MVDDEGGADGCPKATYAVPQPTGMSSTIR